MCFKRILYALLMFGFLWPVEFGYGDSLILNTASQKVPAGTLLKVAFNERLDSRLTLPGEPFTATLMEDFPSADQVILPKGTIIRGRVGLVKRPAAFSRGGAIAMEFDHVMLPSGELTPLTLSLSLGNKIVNKKRLLYSDPGVGKKIGMGYERGRQTFDKVRDAGIDAGRNTPGGLGLLVTVPATITGGAIAGSAITAEKAAVALLGRGESVIINPGDIVSIDFGGSFNLPVQ